MSVFSYFIKSEQDLKKKKNGDGSEQAWEPVPSDCQRLMEPHSGWWAYECPSIHVCSKFVMHTYFMHTLVKWKKIAFKYYINQLLRKT